MCGFESLWTCYYNFPKERKNKNIQIYLLWLAICCVWCVFESCKPHVGNTLETDSIEKEKEKPKPLRNTFIFLCKNYIFDDKSCLGPFIMSTGQISFCHAFSSTLFLSISIFVCKPFSCHYFICANTFRSDFY